MSSEMPSELIFAISAENKPKDILQPVVFQRTYSVGWQQNRFTPREGSVHRGRA